MPRRLGGTESAILALRRALGSDRACLACLAALLCRSRGIPLRGLPQPRPRDLERARETLADSDWGAPTAPDLGAAQELLLADSRGKRSRGAWFTSRELARDLAEATLRPLLAQLPPLSIRVLDPAMGSGRLLLAAGEVLASTGASRPSVAGVCLHGRDLDRLSVEVARCELWLWSDGGEGARLGTNLQAGDSLLAPPVGLWEAVLANPPWVTYSGRAGQPIEPVRRARLAADYASFAGYPTTHGMFLELGARLLRPGGRMGFLVPASVAELPGYRATRASVDERCRVEEPLRDWAEEGFAGVTTPCISVVAARVSGGHAGRAAGSAWRLTASSQSALERGLLERLGGLPTLPPETFGDPGLRTGRADRGAVTPAGGSADLSGTALHQGRDVTEFHLAPPSLRVDPAVLVARLRSEEEWRRVSVVIQQTARWPIAAASDGLPFRNSLLAGYASEALPRGLLLALLNSSLIRWLHYHRNRDARQATHPQVKVGALRAIPLPERWEESTRAALTALGEAWPGPEARARLDALVATAYGLSESEATAVSAWRGGNAELRIALSGREGPARPDGKPPRR